MPYFLHITSVLSIHEDVVLTLYFTLTDRDYAIAKSTVILPDSIILQQIHTYIILMVSVKCASGSKIKRIWPSNVNCSILLQLAALVIFSHQAFTCQTVKFTNHTLT